MQHYSGFEARTQDQIVGDYKQNIMLNTKKCLLLSTCRI